MMQLRALPCMIICPYYQNYAFINLAKRKFNTDVYGFVKSKEESTKYVLKGLTGNEYCT